MVNASVQAVLSAAAVTTTVEATSGAGPVGGTLTVAGAAAGVDALGIRLCGAPTHRMQSMY